MGVSGDKTYTAKFTKDIVYYTITAVAETGGAVSGGGTVAEGGSITLTASAKAGYTFDGWYDGDTKVCDTTEFVVVGVSGDKTYTAKFTKDIVYYTIAAVAEAGGAVSGGGTVAEGGSITLIASAKAGYTFDGWYDGDTKVCDTTEFVVVGVSGDKTYTAKFTKDIVYYTIAAVAETGGAVSGGGTVAEGGSITLIASAKAGYTFERLV